MDKANIMLFVGLTLKEKKTVTLGEFQQYIKSRPEVGKIISAEEIQEVLDELEYVGLVQHKFYEDKVWWSKYDCQNRILL